MWFFRRTESIICIDCVKRKKYARSQRGEKYRNTIKRRKTNWIGSTLFRISLLKYIIEKIIEAITERMRRRGRRRKQLLNDLRENRR
jgi:hypothetical protein